MIFVLLCTFCQCSSSRNESSNGQAKDPYDSSTLDPNKGNYTNQTLADILRGQSGVQVTGSGNSVQVLIRGTKSFDSNTSPLFVVDGVPMGTSFATVNNTVNPVLVKSIRVLKGSASALYGARAANGVIEITMKKN